MSSAALTLAQYSMMASLSMGVREMSAFIVTHWYGSASDLTCALTLLMKSLKAASSHRLVYGRAMDLTSKIGELSGPLFFKKNSSATPCAIRWPNASMYLSMRSK